MRFSLFFRIFFHIEHPNLLKKGYLLCKTNVGFESIVLYKVCNITILRFLCYSILYSAYKMYSHKRLPFKWTKCSQIFCDTSTIISFTVEYFCISYLNLMLIWIDFSSHSKLQTIGPFWLHYLIITRLDLYYLLTQHSSNSNLLICGIKTQSVFLDCAHCNGGRMTTSEK